MNICSYRMLLGLLLLVGPGCVSGPDVVPEAFKTQINPSLHFSEILEEPNSHVGAVVVLGGEVLSAKRLTEGTRLEILQLPLDSSEEPAVDRTSSQGRFLAFDVSFLDPATVPPQTRVTLVGKVTGAKNANLDEMDYRYPVLAIQHLHIWPKHEIFQPESSGPSFGIFGGGSSGGRMGGGVGIGIGF
jgi:outer membrane lipoprotein